MIYLHAKFCMSSSNNVLVIEIKPKAKWNIRTVTLLPFYNLQNITLKKVEHFRTSTSGHHFGTLSLVSLVTHPLHNFTRL
jgi:hypothetical protein